jgi:hypothetical protein
MRLNADDDTIGRRDTLGKSFDESSRLFAPLTPAASFRPVRRMRQLSFGCHIEMAEMGAKQLRRYRPV